MTWQHLESEGCGVLVFPKITALITAVHVRRAIICLPSLHILLSPPALFVTRDTLWVAICNLPPPACPQTLSSSTCSNRDGAYTKWPKKVDTLHWKVNSLARYLMILWDACCLKIRPHLLTLAYSSGKEFRFQMFLPSLVSWLRVLFGVWVLFQINFNIILLLLC